MLKKSFRVLFLYVLILAWSSSSNADCPTQTGVTFTKSGCCTNNVCTAGCTGVAAACADGYTGTATTFNCTVDSSWSNDVTAICTRVCPTPTGSTVTADCCTDNVCVIGCNNVVISCMTTSSGSDVTANCQANGTWSVADVANTCKADCPTPTGGTVTQNTNNCCGDNSCNVGCTGVSITCAPGYSGTATNADCDSNSAWSKTLTDICKQDCQAPNGVQVAKDCCTDGNCTAGCSGVAITCADGYSGTNTTADCASNGGSWNKNITTICTKYCPMQTGMKFTKDGCCTNNVCTAGCTGVAVACADGYTGTATTSNCTVDSSWSDDVTAICTKVCPTPTGSTVTADCCTSGVCVIGCNNVAISCMATYTGSDVTANCQADGTWSVADIANTCTAVCLTPTGSTVNADCCTGNVCVAGCNNVAISCMATYSGTGVTTDCQANGTWSMADVANTCTADCPIQTGVTFTKSTCCADNSCDVGCIGVAITCADGYSGTNTAADCGSNSVWSETVTDICKKETYTLANAPVAAADETSGASDACEGHSKWTKIIILFGSMFVSSLTMLIF